MYIIIFVKSELIYLELGSNCEQVEAVSITDMAYVFAPNVSNNMSSGYHKCQQLFPNWLNGELHRYEQQKHNYLSTTIDSQNLERTHLFFIICLWGYHIWFYRHRRNRHMYGCSNRHLTFAADGIKDALSTRKSLLPQLLPRLCWICLIYITTQVSIKYHSNRFLRRWRLESANNYNNNQPFSVGVQIFTVALSSRCSYGRSSQTHSWSVSCISQ